MSRRIGQSSSNAMLSLEDVDDKRWQNGNVNKENILVIRGTLSFGGLEVKD